MKQAVLLLTVTIAAISFTACNNTSAPSEKNSAAPFDLIAMKKIIKLKNTQFCNAHIIGDTTFLNNIFTPDARVFPPNSDVVTGYSAIAALNLQWVNSGVKEFTEETTALYGNEDYLVDEGTYQAIYGKNKTLDKGKYINIWKKTGGDWKLYSNIWNTSLAETAAK